MESNRMGFSELNEYLELCGYGYRDRARLLRCSTRQTRKYTTGLLKCTKMRREPQYYPKDLILGFNEDGKPIWKIPPSSVTHSCDAGEAKDGSIKLRHHARETIIKTLKLFVLKNRSSKRVVWRLKLWEKAPKRRTETTYDYFRLVLRAEEKGILKKGAIIEFDRVRRNLFKMLEARGYQCVKYPKRYKPYNSLAEGVLGQLARKWYQSYKYFPSEKWLELLKAHLEAIFSNNIKPLLALRPYFRIPEKEEEGIAITVTC